MQYMTRKQFSDKYGCDTGGIHDVINGKHIIEVPYHASTFTRLHEVGHAYLNHQPYTGKTTISEIFKREMGAEVFALRILNKPINRVAIKPAVRRVAELVHDTHYTCSIFRMALKELTEYGCTIDCDDRSAIWDYIKTFLEYENNALKHNN